MKTKAFSIAIFLLLFFSVVKAQEQKKNSSSETKTEIATTSDGRKVILKSDGTWEYYKEPERVKATPPVVAKEPAPVAVPKKAVPVAAPKEPAPLAVPLPPASPAVVPVTPPPNVSTPTAIQKGTLSFEATIASKAIAAGTFYLLNEDLNSILQASGLKPQKGLSLLNTFSMANYGATLGVERSTKTITQTMDSIKPHIVATATSDANGKGEFPSLTPGTYYVMNTSIIFLNTGSLNDRKAILWNVKTQIQSGQNSIALDEKNAVP